MAKPKKPASKKSASKRSAAAAKGSVPLDIQGTELEDSRGGSPRAPVDGVELARRRRLERFGCPVPRCSLLGVNLDTSPRAGRWRRPVALGDEWVSELAISILDAGVSPEALERAAARLRERGGE